MIKTTNVLTAVMWLKGRETWKCTWRGNISPTTQALSVNTVTSVCQQEKLSEIISPDQDALLFTDFYLQSWMQLSIQTCLEKRTGIGFVMFAASSRIGKVIVRVMWNPSILCRLDFIVIYVELFVQTGNPWETIKIEDTKYDILTVWHFRCRHSCPIEHCEKWRQQLGLHCLWLQSCQKIQLSETRGDPTRPVNWIQVSHLWFLLPK